MGEGEHEVNYYLSLYFKIKKYEQLGIYENPELFITDYQIWNSIAKRVVQKLMQQ